MAGKHTGSALIAPGPSRDRVAKHEVMLPLIHATWCLYVICGLPRGAIDDGTRVSVKTWPNDLSLVPRNVRQAQGLLARSRWRLISAALAAWQAGLKVRPRLPDAIHPHADVVDFARQAIREKAPEIAPLHPVDIWANLVVHFMATENWPAVLRADAELRLALPRARLRRLDEMEARIARTQPIAVKAATEARETTARKNRARVLWAARKALKAGRPVRALAKYLAPDLGLSDVTVRRILKDSRIKAGR